MRFYEGCPEGGELHICHASAVIVSHCVSACVYERRHPPDVSPYVHTYLEPPASRHRAYWAFTYSWGFFPGKRSGCCAASTLLQSTRCPFSQQRYQPRPGNCSGEPRKLDLMLFILSNSDDTEKVIQTNLSTMHVFIKAGEDAIDSSRCKL